MRKRNGKKKEEKEQNQTKIEKKNGTERSDFGGHVDGNRRPTRDVDAGHRPRRRPAPSSAAKKKKKQKKKKKTKIFPRASVPSSRRRFPFPNRPRVEAET